ncbi:hypothetical protein E2C01_038502 [Portunus trituberculatus]|uniref:Uncharacterized protein n=1 Tax=Portunus trituberculatus TaxID=210409 RepID=A0A5B7FI60_PORTR|nr:hypothetical protein [Portunus trituberculatus]
MRRKAFFIPFYLIKLYKWNPLQTCEEHSIQGRE